MKKVLMFFFFVGLVTLGCQTRRVRDRVCYQGRCIQVELAYNPEDRAKGLMFRDKLEVGYGMLFIFEEQGQHGFWMKNTLIPLDIIWIDHSRVIVDIWSHVPPCLADPCPVYAPQNEGLYVLEVNAGEAQKNGFKKGARLTFDLPKFLNQKR